MIKNFNKLVFGGLVALRLSGAAGAYFVYEFEVADYMSGRMCEILTKYPGADVPQSSERINILAEVIFELQEARREGRTTRKYTDIELKSDLRARLYRYVDGRMNGESVELEGSFNLLADVVRLEECIAEAMSANRWQDDYWLAAGVSNMAGELMTGVKLPAKMEDPTSGGYVDRWSYAERDSIDSSRAAYEHQGAAIQ